MCGPEDDDYDDGIEAKDRDGNRQDCAHDHQERADAK